MANDKAGIAKKIFATAANNAITKPINKNLPMKEKSFFVTVAMVASVKKIAAKMSSGEHVMAVCDLTGLSGDSLRTAQGIIYEISTIAGATNYTWTVPGSATIIAGQGTKQITVNYNALQTSNQVITVRASNGCGQGAIRSLSGISINSVNCGGPRQSLAMLKDVIAYPNPATDVVNIQFYTEESNKYVVRILDLSGRTIYMEEGFSNAGENTQQLNVSDLASGIYYVELTSAGQTEKIKLMVE